MTRRGMLAAVLALLPAAAFGQGSAPAERQGRAPRSARRTPQAMAPPPPVPPVPDDPAPVPNRDLEAPRDRSAGAGSPRFDPTLIDPNTPRVGATSDPHSPQSREDRLLRQPGAGGRLTVPFSY